MRVGFIGRDDGDRFGLVGREYGIGIVAVSGDGLDEGGLSLLLVRETG